MKPTVALLLTLALAPATGWPKDNHPNDHAQWRGEIDALTAQDAAHPPAEASVVFVGSSSIRKWTTLAADFPGIAVLNRGFGGSELDDSTYFAERIVTPYHPRAIVLYAGDNDLADGDSAATVAREFTDFVRTVRARDPHVPIAFLAIKPSTARANLQDAIADANRRIKTWAATQPGVCYLDVYTPMLGADGKPQSKWFVADGLHMNRAGYQLWTSIVRRWLDSLPQPR